MGRAEFQDRQLVVASAMLIVAAAASAVWVYYLPSDQRDGVVTYAQFVLALAGAVLSLLWLLHAVRRPVEPRRVDALADLLAQVVGGQWRKAATERVLVTPAPIPIGWSLSDLPIAGPVEAAVGEPDTAPGFPPLPGKARVTVEQLRCGGGRSELFDVYAGIGSGRLVVVGAPGAGKSGTAVLLLLDALEHRSRLDDQDRARVPVPVPVPVLFTAHGWDPMSCSVQDWLVTRLVASYPMFQHRGGQDEAVATVAAGAVALIVDGLDEMDQAHRQAALQALSDAPFRVVVLSRSQEMIQAASGALLVGAVAVNLHEITASVGAEYLERARTGPAPSGWTQLLNHLREHPDSELAHGLASPLALTLIRDTYGPTDDLSDLLNGTRQRTSADIRQHLVARVLPNAYTPRPGRPEPRYSLTEATRTLSFLARQMNQDHTRDLTWWRIPRWTPTAPHMLVSMLTGGILGGLLGGLFSKVFGGPINALSTSMIGDIAEIAASAGLPDMATVQFFSMLTFGIGLGLGLGYGHGRGWHKPKQMKSWRALNWPSILTVGFSYGLLAMLAIALIGMLTGIIITGLLFVAAAFEVDINVLLELLPTLINGSLLVGGLVGGLTIGLALGIKREFLGSPGEDEENPRNLIKEQSYQRILGVVGTLTLGSVFGLMFGLLVGILGELLGGLMAGLVVGLAGVLVFVFMGWLTIRLIFGLVPRLAGGFAAGFAEDSARPRGPLELWHSDRVFAIVTGLAFGLCYGLTNGLVSGAYGYLLGPLSGLQSGIGGWLIIGLVGGLITALMVGLVYGVTSSATWSVTLAWYQLRVSHQVPAVHLMPFLEDARKRGVLRTVGPVYQFRHAILQDQ